MIALTNAGIYAFYTYINGNKYYLYIGKDKHINKDERKHDHLKDSHSYKHPGLHDYLANGIEGKDWDYEVLALCDEWDMNEIERVLIEKYCPRFNRN